MEINRLEGRIESVVTVSGLVEGRMVYMTSHSYDQNYGSLTDLPGVDYPRTADQAKKARNVLAFAITTQKGPYMTYPTFDFSLRGMMDQDSNVPFNTDVDITYPGDQESRTVLAGTPARALGVGTYTVPSGQYIYSAGLRTPGCPLSVSYSGANAGKLQAESTFDGDLAVATVVEFDSTTYALTFATRD
jgi:hypothetical protein